MVDRFGIEPIFILRTHLRKGGNTDRNRKETIFLSRVACTLIFYLRACVVKKTKQNKTKQNKQRNKEN